jgi:hypothetical protein
VSGQLSIPEAHQDADLVERSWFHPEHGQCTVTSVADDGVRVVCVGPNRSFRMIWPASLVRRELAAVSGDRRLRVAPCATDPVPCPRCYGPMPCERHPAGPERDEWVSDGAGSFYNRTEHERLAALGLVPLTEFAKGALPERRSEARHPVEPVTERKDMPVATPRKPAKGKKSSLASLTKAKLREHLLSHPTLSDKVWIAAYGSPEREKGETRDAFIKRVLA